MKRPIEIYTDGSCLNNGSKYAIGGWACILICGDKIKEISGSEMSVTNNSMELMAAIKGLEAIKDITREISIYSDSQYLVNTMKLNWSRNANIELWNKLDVLVSRFPKVDFVKVKAHSGNKFNERADILAKAEIDRLGVS